MCAAILQEYVPYKKVAAFVSDSRKLTKKLLSPSRSPEWPIFFEPPYPAVQIYIMFLRFSFLVIIAQSRAGEQQDWSC